MINPVNKKCLNCGYERQPEDESEFIPASECPKCHAIYEKVEKWLNEKEREEQRLKAGQQSREETGLKNKDYNNSNMLKLGKLSIGLNPKKKTMIVTSIALIAFTILSFLYNQIGKQAIQNMLYDNLLASQHEKHLEIRPEATEEFKQNMLEKYELYKNSGNRYLIDPILKKINDGPDLADIMKTRAYLNAEPFFRSEENKCRDRFGALETIGWWLKYISYLTGPLGLIFLLAGLIKSDNFTPI